MADKQLKVTLVKSLHGQLENIAASARGLGLRRIHQTVSVEDTPREPRHDPGRGAPAERREGRLKLCD